MKDIPFEIRSDFQPCGDQPKAIRQLKQGLERGDKYQTLFGATGTGKTFTVAQTIAALNRPALVMAPNKTLAGQLYNEFKDLFPNNAVEYFVSYYDYYQPEAYLPASDTFIEKDSSVNEAIDRMRHSATRSLFERNDVIIVASVSCIYGLGSSEAYMNMLAFVQTGMELDRDKFLARLVEIQYERKNNDFYRGTFRVRGDVVEIFPAYEEEKAIRVEFFGDEVEAIFEIDPLRGKRLKEISKIAIYPNTHYAVMPEKRKAAIVGIKEELIEHLEFFRQNDRLLEAQRLEQRTQFDLEMMVTMGYCNGIENYSRHLTGRSPGEAPPCLIDYFPDNFVTIVDESHVTIPQIGGMYRGDRARKTNLVEHGFRLPSAIDNRPLKFEEWEERIGQAIFVSATPGDWELEKCEGVVVEQVIRPTGLLDPVIEVRAASNQVDDLFGEIKDRIQQSDRILVTTLTKRMSEDLTEYLQDLGIKVRYLHSEIKTIERMAIIRDLRLGVFDVLIGINLLREGLDIPEVSLVAILDADKEGFLRSERSLIQTIGRAARNAEGKVILYADKNTRSMEAAIRETDRRRAIQAEHNLKHNITPTTIRKKISDLDEEEDENDRFRVPRLVGENAEDLELTLVSLQKLMKEAAKELKFEQAAQLRDEARRIRTMLDLIE